MNLQAFAREGNLRRRESEVAGGRASPLQSVVYSFSAGRCIEDSVQRRFITALTRASHLTGFSNVLVEGHNLKCLNS